MGQRGVVHTIKLETQVCVQTEVISSSFLISLPLIIYYICYMSYLIKRNTRMYLKTSQFILFYFIRAII